MKTSQTAKLLQNIMTLQGWTQFDLADRANVHRTTVGQHLNCTRAVRDEHLQGYLKAIPAPDVPRLLAAWLHDLLEDSPPLLDAVLHRGSDRLMEDVTEWAPNLTEHQLKDLEYWSTNIPRDPELATLMEIMTRRARGE